MMGPCETRLIRITTTPDPHGTFKQQGEEIVMASGTRHTYKQELIKGITSMVRRSSLTPLPETCLKDMSTSSLAAFQEWLEPLVKDNPMGKKKKDE